MHPVPSPAPPDTPQPFEQVLQQAARQGRKSERTQARLQAAACRLLETTAPAEIKVADICRAAGTAHGTFYIYFTDIRHLLSETLGAFVTYLKAQMRHASRSGAGSRIRSTTAAYVWLFEQNAGLMRCLVTRMESFPEASAAFERLNRDWAETVADARLRQLARTLGAPPPREDLLRRAYALGGMVDQYLIMMLFGGDPALAELSRDRDAVIETLSLIWERGMQP